MKNKKIPIKWKITAMTLSVVFISILIGMTVFLGLIISKSRDDIGQRTMMTAQIVAQMEAVQRGIVKTESSNNELQRLTERLRSTHGDNYIVILNMNGERLTHPIPERIGTTFSGGDERAAFHEHVYLSEARSDEGRTVRAFVPVLDEDKQQVGVVVVGNLLPHWWSMFQEIIHPLLIFLGFAMTFGILGSWQLAKHIKNETFQMEPHELARTLQERTATFHAIQEGVIAIDQEETITIMNNAAREMLNIQGEALGKKIQEVIPDTRLPEVLQLNEPLLERELYVQGRAIFSNRIPIVQGGKTIGAVAIFQDRTNLTRLARQLTGVQNYVDALRVQNHEYSNKLHTIAGLIQLGQAEKALDYIFQLSDENDQQVSLLAKQIKIESIAGLLLGKINRGKELGIPVDILPESYLEVLPEAIDEHDLVIMIGNLLNNSMESFQSEKELKNAQISFGVFQEEKELHLVVSDNGCGMNDAQLQTIFDKGYSTKALEGRGIGLYLIQAIIERVSGKITIFSKVGQGTEINVTIPMSRGGYDNDGSEASI